MAHNLRFRKENLQIPEKIHESLFLFCRHGIARLALLIKTSFITDADRMAVVIKAMRTYFFQRAAAVYFAVAGQIEMIADVTEAAVVDVVAAAILKAQGHALRRG